MGSFWRSSVVLSYAISIIASAVASQLGLTAAQTGSLKDWLLTGVMGAITFGPVIFNMIFRPSNSAMAAAIVADKVLKGHTTTGVVRTANGQPDLAIQRINVGHN